MDLDLVLGLALLHTSGDWVDRRVGVGGSAGWLGWISALAWVDQWVGVGGSLGWLGWISALGWVDQWVGVGGFLGEYGG